jgi:enoyl reductase-like protein
LSHELDDNKERRQRILALMRQHPEGLSLQKLKAIIMDELGYNLRGASDKVKEMSFMGVIKEKDFRWFATDTLAQSRTRKKEEGRGRVTKASVQEENTRQEETE